MKRELKAPKLLIKGTSPIEILDLDGYVEVSPCNRKFIQSSLEWVSSRRRSVRQSLASGQDSFEKADGLGKECVELLPRGADQEPSASHLK